MASSCVEIPRSQPIRNGEPVRRAADEPRNSDRRLAEISTPCRSPHAGFDADLNPIDDELINTRGSER